MSPNADLPAVLLTVWRASGTGRFWGDGASLLLFPLLSPSPLLPQPELAEPHWSILYTSVVLTLPTDGSCCASLTSPESGSPAPVNYAPLTTPSLSFGPTWPDSLAVRSLCPWPPPASIALPAPLLTLLVLCPPNTVVFWKSCKFKLVFHLLSTFVLATLWEFLTPSSEYLFLSFSVLNQVVMIHKWNSFSRQIYDLTSTPASFSWLQLLFRKQPLISHWAGGLTCFPSPGADEDVEVWEEHY